MMLEAYPAWEELEANQSVKFIESRKPFQSFLYVKSIHRRLDVVRVGAQDMETLKGCANLLTKYKVPYEFMPGSELSRKYDCLNFNDSHIAVIDLRSAFLFADRCMQAMLVSLSENPMPLTCSLQAEFKKH